MVVHNLEFKEKFDVILFITASFHSFATIYKVIKLGTIHIANVFEYFYFKNYANIYSVL